MLPYLNTVCQNLSALNLQQSEQNIHNRSLSGTGGSHNSHGTANRNLHFGMIKDHDICIGIFICDIFQTYFLVQWKLLNLFLTLIIPGIITDLTVMDFFLQVVADTHKERLKIRDRGLIIVDTVDAGKQSHRRHGEG